MLNPNSHIILYAKGWYRVTNYEEDLKKLLAQRAGIEDWKDISRDSIIIVLTEIIYPYMNQYYLREILERTFVKHFSFDEKYTEFERCLMAILSLIGSFQIKDGNKVNILLDEPDYSILPEREEYFDRNRIR